MTEPASPPNARSWTAMVDVQNVRRETATARLRLLVSVGMVFGMPWLLGWAGADAAAVLSIFPALAFYFWSAQALAATDRGPGERSLVKAQLRIQGDDLVVSTGRRTSTFPLSALAGGWTERTPRGHAAVLSFSDGKVVAIEVATEEEGVERLRSLGAGAAAQAVRMRGYRESAGGRRLAGCLLAILLPVALLILLATPVIIATGVAGGIGSALRSAFATAVCGVGFVGFVYWLWLKVRPTWLHIGADGIVVPGLFRERFFRHADIAGATYIKGGFENAYHFVKIHVPRGRFLTVPAASSDEAGAIINRILTASEAATGQERARLLDVLSRNDRPVPEWRRALGALVSKSGYRTPGHDVEDVMRIVEDPAAPVEQRIAAALAVRPHGGKPIEKRIRVAAEACVEPRLRVALEKASTGEIEDAELEALAANSAAESA